MSDEVDLDWRWNQLLDYIEAGLVIPIVGRELLWTEVGDTPTYVPDYLAQQLSARAGLPNDTKADDTTDPIGPVVERYLRSHAGRNWPYIAFSRLTRELEDTPWPSAFTKLAELPFWLYVSATTDNYLERALNAVRFGGRVETVVPRYGLGSKADVAERASDRRTTVFPLLGLANPSADYALTDEDVLEFVHQFQTTGTPRRLLEMLRESHVLLIGDGFPDWLFRLFIRLAKPGRLWTSSTRQLTHFVADRNVMQEPRLLSFLRHPLTDIEVFPVSDARQFVDELHGRWLKRHPFEQGTTELLPAPHADSGKPGGVFLSYCSEDYESVRRIRDTLDGAGIDVWFDERSLQAGDDFRRKIAQEIARSYFFVAAISRNALTHDPRFFRFEWREAEARAKFATFDLPYVMPVVLDDTSAEDERLPLFIRDVQWTRAEGGSLPSKFVTTLVNAYRQIQRPAWLP